MFNNIFKNTREKAENAIEETKNNVTKLTESADKFLSDGNNQMKVITVVFIGIGISMVVSNIVSIVTNISNSKHMRDPKIINNLYINKEIL